MGDDTDHRLLTMRQAAAVLGVSKETIRQRVIAGKLEGRRDNRGRILVALPGHLAAEVVAEVAAEQAGVGGGRGANAAGSGATPVDRGEGLAATAKVGDQAGEGAGWLLVGLLVENARLAEAAAAAERRAATLEEHVSDLRAELARRRWLGLRTMLRRLWAGA